MPSETKEFVFPEKFAWTSDLNLLQLSGIACTKGQWDFNFKMSTGEMSEMPADGPQELFELKSYEVIGRIVVSLNTGGQQGAALAGVRLMDRSGKLLIQCGSFYSSNEFYKQETYLVEDDEKVIGVRARVGTTCTQYYNLQFKLAKLR